MPVLVVFIVLSFVMYLFYKTKQFRTQKPMERKWISGKASIALGVFVLVFGLNTFFIYQSGVSYFIGSMFILIGGLSAVNGYKVYKYFLPHAIAEANHQ
ncbi:hypothetical protein EJF36_15355 [Bacillus sp. HMF5848]|uniref:YtpI family protein n=1 Tax=Bacillus sp. HMF5848 TaxID=2495421 RepID=UPI000F786CED|nr:YtpI family protein [Bacillus sp. HMF5848]RSK28146.1 hypothetical protein EJF36_15355 [Bacillus sp. HMF5848]